MTTSLDTIRYHSGIAGEEVADMVDSLEQEVSTLREQVEKLTKERDELHRAFNQPVPRSEWEKMQEQLAALAEQNEKMRKVLLRLACLGNGDQYGNSIGNCIAQEALSLPNLATPILNRIKAEAYREVADIVENIDVYTFVHGGSSYDDGGLTLSSAATAIRAKADELQ